MKFESINNFKVDISNNEITMNEGSQVRVAKKDPTSIISEAEYTPVSNTRDDIYVMDSYNNTLASFMWGGTIMLTFVVWLVCLISLILNIVKKNVGKAIFSGIGLIVPIISVFVSTLGRTLYEIEESGIGFAIVIFALMLELVFLIMSFVFCFSKNKNK